MIGHRVTVTIQAPAGSKGSSITRVVQRALHQYGANVFVPDRDLDPSTAHVGPNALAGVAATIEVVQQAREMKGEQHE